MHLSTILSAALLVASAIAAPRKDKGFCHQKRDGPGRPLYGDSLSDAEVKKLIDGYTYLLVNPGGPDFNKTANAILTEDFQVFSDSILYLSGRPVSPQKENRRPSTDGTAQWSSSLPQSCRLHRHAVHDPSSTQAGHCQLLL